MRGRKLTQGHISAEVLLDYAEQRADEETAAQVRAHLDGGCARCAAELDVWTRLLAAMRSAEAAAAPEEVVERAIDVFDRRSDSRAVLKPPCRERMALRMAPALAVAAASFHLLFQSAGTDIDLLCEREGGGWRILGQALSSSGPEAGWTVAASGTAGRTVTRTNVRGEFRFSSLGPGVYEVTLNGVERRIILPKVRLEGASS